MLSQPLFLNAYLMKPGTHLSDAQSLHLFCYSLNLLVYTGP